MGIREFARVTEGYSDIKRVFSSGKISHAYLFLGPGKQRKEKFVRSLAAATLCLSEDEKPCGTCRSCHLFAGGNHPDFRIIRPEGEKIKLEQIRELCRDTAYLPYLSKRKIYFFDELDRLTEVAANSFLKTLEEPPKSVVFLALAPGEGEVLPTILSRMQRVYLSLHDSVTEIEEGEETEEAVTDPTVIESFTNGDSLIALFRLAEYWDKVSRTSANRSAIDRHLLALVGIFREKLLREPENPIHIRIINSILRARTYLWTNVNTRLLLEDLYFRIYEESSGKFVVKMGKET